MHGTNPSLQGCSLHKPGGDQSKELIQANSKETKLNEMDWQQKTEGLYVEEVLRINTTSKAGTSQHPCPTSCPTIHHVTWS